MTYHPNHLSYLDVGVVVKIRAITELMACMEGPGRHGVSSPSWGVFRKRYPFDSIWSPKSTVDRTVWSIRAWQVQIYYPQDLESFKRFKRSKRRFKIQKATNVRPAVNRSNSLNNSILFLKHRISLWSNSKKRLFNVIRKIKEDTWVFTWRVSSLDLSLELAYHMEIQEVHRISTSSSLISWGSNPNHSIKRKMNPPPNLPSLATAYLWFCTFSISSFL